MSTRGGRRRRGRRALQLVRGLLQAQGQQQQHRPPPPGASTSQTAQLLSLAAGARASTPSPRRLRPTTCACTTAARRTSAALPAAPQQLEVNGKRYWIVRLVSEVMYGDLSLVGDSSSGRYSSSRVDRVAESSSFGSLHAVLVPAHKVALLRLGEGLAARAGGACVHCLAGHRVLALVLSSRRHGCQGRARPQNKVQNAPRKGKRGKKQPPYLPTQTPTQ